MEKLRRPRLHPKPAEQAPRAAALAEEARAEQPTNDVMVIYGASVQPMPLAGLTVEHVRPLVEVILNVDPESPILINGRPGRRDQVIDATDVVEFVHHAGEKGARGWS